MRNSRAVSMPDAKASQIRFRRPGTSPGSSLDRSGAGRSASEARSAAQGCSSSVGVAYCPACQVRSMDLRRRLRSSFSRQHCGLRRTGIADLTFEPGARPTCRTGEPGMCRAGRVWRAPAVEPTQRSSVGLAGSHRIDGPRRGPLGSLITTFAARSSFRIWVAC